MNNVIVDADGVILDYLRRWELAGEEVFGKKIVQVSPAYPLDIRYGMTKEDKDILWQHFEKSGHWSKIPALDGAVQAIVAMQSAGLSIHVVTSISDHILEQRKENFRNIGMPEVEIHCSGSNKIDHYRRLNPIAVIDDNPHHLQEAFELGIKHRIFISTHPEMRLDNPFYATYISPSLHDAHQHILSGLNLRKPNKIM